VEEKGVVVREELFTLCEMFEELDLILPDKCFDGPMQMALDEVLLSSVTKPTLRIYRWSSPWVTFGYFQKHAEVSLSYPGMPCVRRWTGGGMVEHGLDHTFSLMIPKGYSNSMLAPTLFYRKLHALIAEWLCQELGSSVGMVSGEEVLQGSSCFTAPAKDDLLLGGRKILGGAQRRSAGALLYQGSLQGLEIDGLKALPTALLGGELPKITPLSGKLIAKAASLSKIRYGCPTWNTRG
jgi:lipoate-protein ligase A